MCKSIPIVVLSLFRSLIDKSSKRRKHALPKRVQIVKLWFKTYDYLVKKVSLARIRMRVQQGKKMF